MSLQAMQRFSALVFGFLLLLFASCTEEKASTPQASPTPSLTASGETLVCAGDSTQRFLEVQHGAPFKVYCPTFLPRGFTFEDIQFGEVAGAAAPPEGAGALRAIFRRDDPEGKIEFIQGRPGVAVIAEIPASGQELQGETAYDGFQANLFERATLARSPDGHVHIISVERLTTDELRQIAAAMRPLSP